MPSLELYLVTFNCARTLVDPASLASHFFDALPEHIALPDVIAISLQEIAPISYSFLRGSYLTPYYRQIETTIGLAVHQKNGHGERYANIFTKNMGMTALMVFAKEQVMSQVKSIESAATGVGFWDMGNKGAVGAKITFQHAQDEEGLEISFIAAHLAPMESAYQRRNEDWETIVRNLVFMDDTNAVSKPGDDAGEGEDQPLLGRPDLKGLYHARGHVFFCGDLNYRTSDVAPGDETHKSFPQPVESEISPLHFSRLLKDDQLTRERRANRTLHGFEELPVTFPPTYKLSHKPQTKESTSEETSWQWAKHRFPSWCDRCLYLPPPKSSPPLKLDKYTSLPIQPTSDHKPVALSVSVPLSAWVEPDSDDVRNKPPFPVNPHWKSRLDASKRNELIVGVLAYLTTTNEGLAITIASLVGVVTVALVLGSMET